MRVSVARSSLRLVLAALLALPLLALGPGVRPAAAAVAGPTGLSPDATTVSGTPVFTWDAMPDATVYDVQVIDNDGVTLLTSVSNTVNNHWVPTTFELPTGRTLTWQVRGLVNGVESDWSSATFTRAAVDAPVLISPADGAVLLQPGDPLIYRWKPVPAAKNYTVEVSPDHDFVDPALIKTYTTSATMIAPNIIPADGIYYWRVTANLASGLKSNRSDVRGYTVTAVVRSGGDSLLPGDPVYPANGQTIDDVVLEWHPIDGATTYTLQISTDSNFNTVVSSVSGIKSTRYSPPTTLDNDQYWWRIAPVNVDGYQTPWGPATPTWWFTRRWADQPHLQYPADGTTVGDPFYFQWTPVHLASHYVIEMSPNSSFTPSGSVTACSTVHTTYTPSQDAGDCWPGAAGTYYWRVKAFDDNAGVVSEYILGEVNSFTYDPALVTLLAPANGATVQVPTLSWEPYPNADHYNVTLTPSGGSPTTKTTIGTSMTWPSKLGNGVTYRWQVQPVFDDGRVGASILLASQPTFTAQDPDPAVATSPEPISAGAPAVRPPLLTWTPVAGATSYTVQVRAVGTIGWSAFASSFAYASGSDTTGLKMSPGDYEWQVVAHGGANDGTISSSSIYTILPFDSVGGYRAAITGADSGDVTKSCTAQLPNDCQNLRQTPVLRWDPVEGAAFYKLVISHDQNLTNPVLSVNVRGTNLWMDPNALPDADALTAYFWDVVPCGPTGVCKTQTPATHQFNKTGLPVTLVSPLNDVQRPNDIRFSWQDYLTTLQADTGADSSLSTPATTEAQQYRIQVDNNADFSSPLDTRVVDQTTYTPYALTYPEQPLYWRVQAIDGSGNPLPWSSTRTVTKSSPGPVLREGSSGETFSGSISLGWDPLAFARTYEVRIYPAGVDPDIATALITAAGLKQNSYTPGTPLAPGSYIWRARRADADGRAGQWSAQGSFTSAGLAPTLVSPADAVELPPRTSLFTWEPATDAPVSSYRVQLTRAEGSSPSAVTTNATSYAPTTRLADGHWTWTVAAIDTDGNVLGTSAARSFVVNGTLLPTGPVTIQGSGSVGSVLTILPFTWNQPDTTTTYQWYRGTSAITGATGPTYTVTSSDVGKAVKVRVTGHKAGYDSGAGTDSNTIGVAGTTSSGTTTGKVSSQTTETLARKKIRKRKHGLVYVTVTASVPPTGTIRAYDKSRLLTSVTLTAGAGGKITIRLPRLKVGKHRIWVQYLGSTKVTGSSSGRLTLRVV